MSTTRTRLTAAALAAVLALSACAGESAPEAAPEPAAASGAPDPGTSDLGTSTPASRAEDWPRTVSVGGAELTLDAPPARIVATSTEVGDLALELVGHERVAAVSAGSATEGTGNQLDAARRVATVLPAGNDPDPEKLLSLEPDLVLLVGRHAGEHDVAALLAGSGVPTVAFEPTDFATPDDVIGTVTELGRALGADGQATAITDRIRAQVDEARDRASRAADAPRTVVLMARGGRPMLMGAHSATTRLVELAGGTSVAAESGWTQAISADPEAIVAAAPEVILVQDFRDQGLAPFQELLDNPALAQVPAVASGRVHLVDAETTSGTAGSRIGEGLLAIVDVLHPGA